MHYYSAERRLGVNRWCARGSSIARSPGRRSHPLSLYPSRPILTYPSSLLLANRETRNNTPPIPMSCLCPHLPCPHARTHSGNPPRSVALRHPPRSVIRPPTHRPLSINPPTLHDSRRPRKHHALRDHHPLRILDIPLLRARRVRARCGMVGEQGEKAGVGRFCGGGEARVVETGARAGVDAFYACAASVTCG